MQKLHDRALWLQSQGIRVQPQLQPQPLRPPLKLPLPPPLPQPTPAPLAVDRWDPPEQSLLAPLLVGNCGQRAPVQLAVDEMVGVECYH